MEDGTYSSLKLHTSLCTWFKTCWWQFMDFIIITYIFLIDTYECSMDFFFHPTLFFVFYFFCRVAWYVSWKGKACPPFLPIQVACIEKDLVWAFKAGPNKTSPKKRCGIPQNALEVYGFGEEPPVLMSDEHKDLITTFLPVNEGVLESAITSKFY